MEPEQNQLATLFPDVAAQMRGALSNLYLAAAQLVPDQERENDPELDGKAARLDQSYYQLLRLVNSLSSAALLTNRNPLPLQDRDLVDFVAELCERVAPLAQMLEIDLRFTCAMPQHICAVAPNALETLVYHLLSNALKFTPAGGTVTVDLRVKGSYVVLSVTDTGCGIPAERIPTLFERYLEPGHMDPPPHGLGLGLPLCRRIAEGHGGSLMAESREGAGSRFVLSLPDKKVGGGVSDVRMDYSGGFNKTLLALADALPAKAFLLRNLD